MLIFSTYESAIMEQNGVVGFDDRMQISVNIIKDVIEKFSARYILFHFVLILTGNVNQWGKVSSTLYSPMSRHFLSNLLRSLFPVE